MKVSFFLMTQKGYEVLNKFINHFGAECISTVVTSRDNNVECDYYEQIVELCMKNNIMCFNKSENYQLKGEHCFVISWRWLIKSVNAKLIVFHDSLLPKYRGFSPLVSCLINGEEKVGVSALLPTENYDEGAILGQESTNIQYPIKIQKAIELVSECYVKLVIILTEKILNNEELIGYQQNENEATYSLWRDEEDYRINWNCDATYIRRFIDSVGYPYNGASSYLDNSKVRILDATELDDVVIENRDFGKVIFIRDSKPVIVCGRGLLQINQMVDDTTKESLLPLSRFRRRFK